MTSTRDPMRVLFVCTGNSARSLMAEVLLRHHGGDRFEVHSAGTEPRGVNPLTVRVIQEAGLDPSGLRSTSVSAYLNQTFEYVITVCDRAREACPVFPGGGEALHWGYDDPAAVEGTAEERHAAFRAVFILLSERIAQFAVLAQRQSSAARA